MTLDTWMRRLHSHVLLLTTTSPLCIEQLDLSDRNFRPCPCGYQICQFCFNNIKTNMNGLCPACRRPYDEKTIQWKVVTTEE